MLSDCQRTKRVINAFSIYGILTAPFSAHRSVLGLSRHRLLIEVPKRHRREDVAKVIYFLCFCKYLAKKNKKS